MEGAMLPNYNLNEGEDDFVSKSSVCRLTLIILFPFLFENGKFVFSSVFIAGIP